MKTFLDRIAEPELIIIDGGTGTEMEKRGAKMESRGWSASSSITQPDLLRQIHKDYIDVGAEVIITNTYACSKQVMEECGIGEQFEEANRLSAKIACEVRDTHEAAHQVWVAGSMSPDTFGADRLSEKVLQDNFDQQAAILAKNGVDFFMLEMLWDVEITSIMIEAVKKTGLPVILGFTYRLEKEHKRSTLAKGGGFGALLPHLDLSQVPMITIMHSLIDAIPVGLSDLKANWSGPTGVYAHYGVFQMPNWVFNDMITPEAYADEADNWIKAGASLIGGCCGIGPAHIEEISRRFR
ncbi:MAG: homocysteine S-methyltransferase family protein [Chloroflexota bacterium]